MTNSVTYKSNWWGFIGKRVLIAVIAFFIFSFAMFYTVNSPMQAIHSTPILSVEEVREIIKERGLDKPKIERYFNWLESFFTGDWGNSWVHRIPVKDLLF
jgi:peptide/nickel transport system permease protein